MGIDCKVCLEALIDGRWTHLTFFSLERDGTLYERLGFEGNSEPTSEVPEHWSAVSRWLFWNHGGWNPTTMPLDTFRKLGEQRRLDQPERFDLRPGWTNPLEDWLNKAVVEDPEGWSVSDFLGQWPPDPSERLGTEIRLCLWFF